MEMVDILNYISNNGFAIFVAAFLLYDRTKTTAEMKEVLINNTTALEKLIEKMDGGGNE